MDTSEEFRLRVLVGNNIKSLRKSSNTTQETLANYLKMSKQQISKFENALSLPDLSVANSIAQYFKIPLDTLVNAEIEPDNLINEITLNYNTYTYGHIDYEKIKNNKYHLYHYRTKDNIENSLGKGILTIKDNEEKRLYTVEMILYRELPHGTFIQDEYTGALVLSGLYYYIFLKGKRHDSVLIALPSPLSYDEYISEYTGGIGFVLSNSEGFKNAIPCMQHIILSKFEIPKSKHPAILNMLKLPECNNSYLVKYDHSINDEVHKFICALKR